jgi:putative transcriptional regulator
MSEYEDNLYLSGKILLATPQMTDPRFSKAVILICGHDENGAMGLVINNVIADVGFADLIEELDIATDNNATQDVLAIQILDGGPMEKNKGFLLHSTDFKKAETIEISKDYALTGTLDALHDVAQGQGPEKLLFILGYAGWTEGQLEEELKQNVWLVIETDNDFIFNISPEQKWTKAIKNLGFDPAHLSAQRGSA